MRTHFAPRNFRRAVTAALATTALVAGAAVTATPALADSAVAPSSSQVTIVGAGWGHGKGMSQYGAYGAASKGLSYKEIISFYYPGTKLTNLPKGNTIRVLISADTDNGVHFRPAAGLKVTDSAGKSIALPTSSKYTKWRVSRSGKNRVLYYRNTAGKYVKYANKLNPNRIWYVSNSTSGVVKLAMPDGSTRSYRGKLAARFSGSGLKTVNYLPMESYLRGVVAAEMPASWLQEALKAQSVAARTYAAKLRSQIAAKAIYDLCDTSACQVYKGVSAEHANTDKAIAGSADDVVTYKDKLALTMFSSSNGGWSASGGTGYPYLKAQKDPYDGVKRTQSWSVTLSSKKIQSAYPSIGTLTAVQITARDGDGTYGGRVDKVKISGSKGSVTVTGGSFKSKFGLKERLFKFVSGGTSTLSITTDTSSPTPTPDPSDSAEPAGG